MGKCLRDRAEQTVNAFSLIESNVYVINISQTSFVCGSELLCYLSLYADPNNLAYDARSVRTNRNTDRLPALTISNGFVESIAEQ